jgi:very-short-patch-repair endonuclease
MVYLGKTRARDMFINAKSELFQLAREMRKNPTDAEKLLWTHLRKLRAEGIIFRRQHPIDFFIADFFCHSLKLIIEVDGGIHSIISSIAHDDSRSGELERFGIKIIRFKNEEIINNIDSVTSNIKLIIRELTSPSHSGRGGQRG